jgi:hypothetical protein
MATAHNPSTAGTTAGDRRGMTPAQGFALAGGLGFLADSSFDTGSGVDGDSLLGFEVNGWHNIVHLLTGLLLLSGFRRNDTAITVCLIFAGGYAIVTLWGLIDGDDVLGLVPINAADNVLHIVLTLAAAGAALVSRREARSAH